MTMRPPAVVRAHAREVAFVLKLLPMVPSGVVDRDVASRTREDAGRVVPWAVDLLTRDVFERTIRALLGPEQARSVLVSTPRSTRRSDDRPERTAFRRS